MRVLLTNGRNFSINFKNGNQHTGVVVLVDSHPIQHVRHMKVHLNGVMLLVRKLLLILFYFSLLTEDDRVIDF